MALNDIIHVHCCLLFEIVDVLSHVLPELSLVLEHLDEVVGRGRIEFGQVEVLSKLVERLRVAIEVVQHEESFGLGQVVLLKVVVDASPGRSEVGDAG